MEQLPNQLSTISIQKLAKRLDHGKSTIWDWLNEKSPRHDPTFPKPIRSGKSSTRWIVSEVDQWILDRAEQRRKGSEAAD